MIFEAVFWILLNLFSIAIQAFYSMMEMAFVSFSKVRLEYYVSVGDKKAQRIKWLMQNSSRLFGTTLIGVNVAMMFGSEFSRMFYESLGLSPDLAPLSQVMIVIIFGELAPMFAARRYPEHTTMLGANVVYFSAKLMKPVLWGINIITKAVHSLFGGADESMDLYLNQDEIKHVLEEHHEDQPTHGTVEELNLVVSNIFDLRSKTAKKIMSPLKQVIKVPSKYTIKKMRQILLNTSQNYLPLYHRNIANIVGIAYPRDILREADNKRISDYARQPWFITQDLEVVHILHQFRSNKQSVAVVLDQSGKAIGIVTLEDVFNEIFGGGMSEEDKFPRKRAPIIERTFSGNMRVQDFNQTFGVNLEAEENETFAELMTRFIGHHPEVGDTIKIPPFELQVKESTLLEVKQIIIKTKVS